MNLTNIAHRFILLVMVWLQEDVSLKSGSSAQTGLAERVTPFGPAQISMPCHRVVNGLGYSSSSRFFAVNPNLARVSMCKPCLTKFFFCLTFA